MATPDERREASYRLGDAILKQLEENGFVDGVLGDWVVVACTVNMDEEGDPFAQYHLCFSGGSMLDHVALGMLEQAKDLLMRGEMRDGPAESE